MEEKEIEKGVISEDALDDIVGGLKIGGLNIDKEKLVKGLKYAGIVIAGAGALAGAGAIINYGIKKASRKKEFSFTKGINDYNENTPKVEEEGSLELFT